MVDEAYMQVVRQTRDNPNFEAQNRMWVLLLVLSTVLLPSPVIQPFIRQVLALAALGESKIVANIAQLAYLRFDSRCRAGGPLRAISAAFLNDIPKHVRASPFTIGASLFELMKCQMRSNPRMRVPVFLHAICQWMIGHWVLETEGVWGPAFLSKDVETLASELDTGRDIFDAEVELGKMAGLFKFWLAELPNPLLTVETFPALATAKDNPGAFIEIVEGMTQVHQDVLGYLIGFLKVVAEEESQTKVNAAALAAVFGPLCVRTERGEAKKPDVVQLGTSVILTLLNSWATAALYPIDETW
jgi:hypothetical protein